MKITVFTPTYNRAYIIENLYRSLQRQTFRDFEWLIVDDGSSDNTEELINGWINENDFPVVYFKQPNGGKCSAINKGLDLAKGELFFTVDSDDYLTDDALEKIVSWEACLEDKERYCGIMANRGSSYGKTPNTLLTNIYGENCEYIDEYAFVRYSEYTTNALDGEKADVWYTDLHRKYKYPVFDGENFLTEAVVWNRMAHDGYKIRFFDDVIWICEYLDDGLTKAGSEIFLKNPQGHGLCLREKAEFLNYSIKNKMKMWYTYYCDHSFCDEKYRLTKKQCARYIGAPVVFVYMSAIARKLNGLIKKIRK